MLRSFQMPQSMEQLLVESLSKGAAGSDIFLGVVSRPIEGRILEHARCF